MDVRSINERFSIEERLYFVHGPGGLTIAELRSPFGKASVALQGGQVLDYIPARQQGVLWTSRQARFAPGQSIRGGIPVCWPWFGAHPDDSTKPNHGFVRVIPWQVLDASSSRDGVQLRLAVNETAESRTLWDHPFRLVLMVSLGRELTVALETVNTATESLGYTMALHSYFAVSDIEKVQINGLEDGVYLDKVQDFKECQQRGPIIFTGETDRIYLRHLGACTIEDGGWQRRIRIAKAGSASTVVWNPWEARARAFSDFGDGEFRHMVCVETANAASDAITLGPGQSHRLEARIAVD